MSTQENNLSQEQTLKAAQDLAAHLKTKHPNASEQELRAILTLALLTTDGSWRAANLLTFRGFQN